MRASLEAQRGLEQDYGRALKDAWSPGEDPSDDGSDEDSLAIALTPIASPPQVRRTVACSLLATARRPPSAASLQAVGRRGMRRGVAK